MTDLGRPFSEPYQDVIAALEDHIRHGVQHARFVFEGVEAVYPLPERVSAVTLVSGVRNGEEHVFGPGRDYRFTAGRILWLPTGDQPDPGSRFEVLYIYRDEHPAGLTDFTPGSVVGTLVRAIARQMKLIYDQMDEAYRRAFIDEATGVALDNVVALLGIVRNPALRAAGEVTFYRTTQRGTTVVREGTRVADERGRTFVTTRQGEIPPQADELATRSDGALRTTNRIAEVIGVWRQGESPESANPLANKSSTVVGADERTVTRKQGAWPEEPLLIRYKPKSVTVPVEALQAGPEGNVGAQAIVIMPTPPRGIGGVVNERHTEGGLAAESDDQLRERAKHALERAGNATLNAIKYAVLDVDGVEGVEVVDHSVDDSVPLGEVRVRYSGGDTAQVESVIDNTRAAGILARPDRVEQVLVSGTFYLIPEPNAPATAAGEFLSAAVEAVRGLDIGAPLSIRRLNALAYNVAGLADVAEAQLDQESEQETDRRPVTDPLLVDRSTLIAPHPTDLTAELVSSLRASTVTQEVEDLAAQSEGVVRTTRRIEELVGVWRESDDPETDSPLETEEPLDFGEDGRTITLAEGVRPEGQLRIRYTARSNQIEIELVGGGEQPIAWRDLSLDLSVVLRAKLKNAPEQPPERVGSFTRTLVFTDQQATTATLTVAAADAPDFRPADHERDEVEVAISAAAYPGIGGVQTSVDLPVEG
jgi:uncharacterized phage protein gp47/JayE